MRYHLLLISIASFVSILTYGQADTALQQVPAKYVKQVSSRASKLEEQLDKKSEKILNKFLKSENKLQKKLAKKDSVKAKEMLANTQEEYAKLKQKLSGADKLKKYIPSLDSMGSSLKFLQDNPQLMAAAKDGPKKLNEAISKVNGLESEFQKAEEIKKFIQERKQYLKQQFGNLNITKELKQLNKEAYYYSAQVREYKEILKDHRKIEQKSLELLSKTDLFKDFMKKNSQLASLFRLPGSNTAGGAANVPSLAGLQTRSQVNGLIQQQLSAGGPNAQAQFSQNMQQAQSQLNQLKQKFTQLGGSGDAELDMPDGFKPNSQKTKSFLQRIELGANMQSQKANGYFPVTSDIGLSAGYKLNDKSVIGIGASYKMGWGQNIRNIRVTHQGIGLRSFVDVKLKGSFWMTGGYELNYRNGFSRFAELRDRSAWLESGLIGLSKVIDLRSKLLKKTKMQLMWDFLSYRQVPRTSAIVFRVGYTIH